MKPKLKLVESPSLPAETLGSASGTQIVRLRSWTNEGPLVSGVESQDTTKLARWSSSVVTADLVKSCGDQVEVLVVYTADGVPVIMALLAVPAPVDPQVDVRVDGRRVELVANEELTLRCGDACISLMKDGRVIVRGVQVETRAKGANRIRGGTVEIN